MGKSNVPGECPECGDTSDDYTRPYSCDNCGEFWPEVSI